LSYGGILADSAEVEEALLGEALELGRSVGAARLELRQQNPLQGALPHGIPCAKETHKARLVLPLPDSPDELLRSFTTKLRTKIRRGIKKGLLARIGGSELLGDFYSVFSRNMRDLGSPVHSRRLFDNLFSRLGREARVALVSQSGVACAAGILIRFRDTVELPWSSSLRSLRHLSPHMLLHWTLLEHSCENGCRYFDFGRSTVDDGTYLFKTQWGAVPHTLHWYSLDLKGTGRDCSSTLSQKTARRRAVALAWSKTPLFLANRLGPILRKRISL
jgi:FemAB-related protein (PEP-CTERM system-associated)